MSFDINDPRLTAYVLGELSDEDREAVEDAISRDPALAGEVEAIRIFCELLKEELLQDDEVRLTDAQHRAIENTIMNDSKATPDIPPPSPDLPKPSKPPTPDVPPSKARVMIPLLIAVLLTAVGVGVFATRTEPVQSPTLAQKSVAPPLNKAPHISTASTPISLRDGKKIESDEEKNLTLQSSLKVDRQSAQDIPTDNRSSAAPTLHPTKNQRAHNGPATITTADKTSVRTESPSDFEDKLVATNKEISNTHIKKLEALGYSAGVQDGDGKGKKNDTRRGYLKANRFADRSRGDRAAASERYAETPDNPFRSVAQKPQSTFSIDVDTASYANTRRFLQRSSLPPTNSVRVEEMINYFKYNYAPPTGEHPFAVHVETTSSPWNPKNRLVRVGLKGREVAHDQRPASNLVFLIDVSGSMSSDNKLPLLIKSMKMLVQNLDERDRIAIVVYAGASGLVLPSTPGNQKAKIFKSLDRLGAGGSTNGGAGIELAYQTAVANFAQGGINRVILATDGDFNVGSVRQHDLTALIERKAKTGVFLSVLGFGMGNLNDSMLEQLADKGNGNYAYIDTIKEAKKALVHDINGTLMTIAKDVKIQVEFNPKEVASYRLIGYNNRLLAAHEFDDDTKDAGEIGAGHTVTALYELIPRRSDNAAAKTNTHLKYQDTSPTLNDAAHSGELLNLKLRYKLPNNDTSTLLESPVFDSKRTLSEASPETQFAISVAMFGTLLRNSPMSRSTSWDDVTKLARRGSSERDPFGYREEFMTLIRKAKGLTPSK